MLYTIAGRKNQGSNNMTSKWTKLDWKYTFLIEVQVFIDALHNHYKGLSK